MYASHCWAEYRTLQYGQKLQMLLQNGICTYSPSFSHAAKGSCWSNSFLKVKGCTVRVSHILVRLVIIPIGLLNVL